MYTHLSQNLFGDKVQSLPPMDDCKVGDNTVSKTPCIEIFNDGLSESNLRCHRLLSLSKTDLFSSDQQYQRIIIGFSLARCVCLHLAKKLDVKPDYALMVHLEYRSVRMHGNQMVLLHTLSGGHKKVRTLSYQDSR